MKLENVLHGTIFDLLVEFTEKTVDRLVIKFSSETDEGEDVIRKYINQFEKIKNSPKIENKDLLTYTWDQLEDVLLHNRNDDVKVGKLGKGEVVDGDLVYNNNGLRVYKGDSKKNCIKYGNGYTYCISSRGADNLYGNYRFKDKGTPYFVFDDNKTTDKDEDGKFIDEFHAFVVIIFEDPKEQGGFEFLVTSASNGQKDYTHFNNFEHMSKVIPRFAQLEGIFKNLPTTREEQLQNDLKVAFQFQLQDLNDTFSTKTQQLPKRTRMVVLEMDDLLEMVKVVNGTKQRIFLQPDLLYDHDYDDYDSEDDDFTNEDERIDADVTSDHKIIYIKTNDNEDLKSQIESYKRDIEEDFMNGNIKFDDRYKVKSVVVEYNDEIGSKYLGELMKLTKSYYRHLTKSSLYEINND